MKRFDTAYFGLVPASEDAAAPADRVGLRGGEGAEATHRGGPRGGAGAELPVPAEDGGDAAATLAGYVGAGAVGTIVGGDRQRAYQINAEQMRANYSGGVEYQLRERLVVLCRQTADWLYAVANVPALRYVRGSRVGLERVVEEVTEGAEAEQAKALALMRFCRDLYKKVPARDIRDGDYVFGGTEEELIDKGEELCECLGRLYVALCEIAGLPARIVMHVIGGHITAEVLVEGRWGYLDPRTGVYFLKEDGRMASLWELMGDPALVWRQGDDVKRDVSDRWTWEERAAKCVEAYFRPEEVNGFMYYSLADADQYDYRQTTQEQGTKAGMWEINRTYIELSKRVFSMSKDDQVNQGREELRHIPLMYRHDGFTSYWYEDAPMSGETLNRLYVDAFHKSNVETIAWGLGPGSVFCFDTKVGEIFGDGITDERWRTQFRSGDRRVHETVKAFIASGKGPLVRGVERGHELGLKVYGKLELNHEYGPARDDNWNYVGFVGKLNKEHPEYRIKEQHPDLLNLDFAFPEVREFKLAVLREAAEKGVDGLELDFLVYPPHMAEPDPAVLTGFVRDVRTMLDDVGAARGERLELAVRIPADRCEEAGIDWKTWMREGLVDILLPAAYYVERSFEYNIDEFVKVGRETNCKVYGGIWFALGLVCTDEFADDEDKGKKYDKEKTRGMFYAQALLQHRAGVDGIELSMTSTEWHDRPYLNDLADPKKLEFADKHYMVDNDPYMPVRFDEGDTKRLPLRSAEDIGKAGEQGYEVAAKVVLYCSRELADDEQISISVNGGASAVVTRQCCTFAGAAEAVDMANYEHTGGFHNAEEFLFDKEWWRRGEHTVSVDSRDFRLGDNELVLTYREGSAETPLAITWVDVLFDYRRG